MIKQIKWFIHIGIALSILVSCTSAPAHQIQTDSNNITAPPYGRLGVTEKKESQPRFFIKDYVTGQKEDYLLVEVKNGNQSLLERFYVLDCNKFKNVRLNKGFGYRGAELRNLKFKTVNKRKYITDFTSIAD